MPLMMRPPVPRLCVRRVAILLDDGTTTRRAVPRAPVSCLDETQRVLSFNNNNNNNNNHIILGDDPILFLQGATLWPLPPLRGGLGLA